MMQNLNELQKLAAQYANEGFYIFPCTPGGKAPLTQNGFKNASNDPAQIMQWWKMWPNANIGLVTGQINSLWVLDIDAGGDISLLELEKIHGKLPQTKEIITGSGGRHLYFSWSAQSKIPNSVGKLGKGLDVRGDDGYVIAPPSFLACGGQYKWHNAGGIIQPAPLWLIELVQSSKGSAQGKSPEEWRELVKAAPEGQRNDTVTKIAGKLLHSGIDPYMALDLCLCWNESRCKPPLSSDEVFKVVNSIAGKEFERRGGGHG